MLHFFWQIHTFATLPVDQAFNYMGLWGLEVMFEEALKGTPIRPPYFPAGSIRGNHILWHISCLHVIKHIGYSWVNVVWGSEKISNSLHHLTLVLTKCAWVLAIPWDHLPHGYPTKEEWVYLPCQPQLWIAPQLGWGLSGPSFLHTGIFTNLILSKSYNSRVMSTDLTALPPSFSSYNLSAPTARLLHRP